MNARAGWYEVQGRAEPIRHSPGDRAQVLILPPLFGELNRCRRLLADVMAALAGHAIGGWLPDLPGTGESLREIEDVSWEDWRAAAAAAAGHVRAQTGTAPVTLSARGGALLDAVAERRWRLAPASGAALLRDLVRTRRAADREAGRAAADLDAAMAAGPVELAGYRLAPALTAGLRAAEPVGAARTRALGGEGAESLPGPRSGGAPSRGRSTELASAIAADVAAWIAACAVS